MAAIVCAKAESFTGRLRIVCAKTDNLLRQVGLTRSLGFLMAARPIYLDNQATTPIDPRVLEAMMPFLTDAFGNASSKHHRYGWFAAEAVDVARNRLAELLGATPQEIVFTSGATESNNLALKGVARRFPGCHIVTQATEHKAVLDVVGELKREGHSVTVLGVDEFGHIDLEALRDALRAETRLVSIMHGNNEVGTVHDLQSVGELCRDNDTFLHTDATQTVGRVPIDLRELPVDLLSMSAHKLYGPKGVGALYVRRRAPRVVLEPLLHGGGHERAMRSGTLNVPGIVGLGAAAELADSEMAEDALRGRRQRDDLERRLRDAVSGLRVNGPSERLYCNLNVSFPGASADALLLEAREIAASTGSACSSASLETSHVLRAMGFDEERVSSSVRLSVGRFTSDEDIVRAGQALADAYACLNSK